MRLLNQSCEAFVQEPGLTGIYKQIERAGRTCYKSTDKITAESAKPFVDRMVKSNHTAMLEHGTVYLRVPVNEDVAGDFLDAVPTWTRCKLVQEDGPHWWAVTTNLRVIVENDLWEHLKYLCEPTEFHVKRYTLSCTTALHCYKDLTRHRVFSFAIESTRFCNYLKEKFGASLAYIMPTWYEASTWLQKKVFKTYLWTTEKIYLWLVKSGWQAQQAAEVLPQCVKGDMIITGFEDDWQHLLDLRYYGTTGAPHPMVKELATLMREELAKQGFDY